MCCGGGFPDPGGYVIASLKKGDEITLREGLGHPSSDQKRTLVIYRVDGFSALCTDGTMLMCTDGGGITKTGRTLEARPSALARQVVLKVQIRKIGSWFGDRAESIKTRIWWINYRIKRRLKAKRA